MSLRALIRSLFGTRAKSAAGFLTAAAAGDTPASARLASPYAQSAWVRAAVNLVAGEISSRALHFHDGETRVEDPALLDWWTAPAIAARTAVGGLLRLPLPDVLETLAIHTKLHGEFFLLLDDSWLLATARSRGPALPPFLIAEPQRVRLVMERELLRGYEYVDTAGRRLALLPEQVVHWHNFNPDDPLRGIGDLRAALVAAEAAHATSMYVRDLMRNNNDNGYIVVGKSGPATDEQRAQITAALREKRAALARGQARDLFLTGDLAVERPKEQAATADLHTGNALTHQEIFTAFGVPPSMAEVKASYSIGSASDRYQLITSTCMALGQRIAAALARVASMQTGRPLTADCDWDDHPVMIEARRDRIASALQLWGAGMPMKQINAFLSLGMAPYKGWDSGYLPFSVSPVGSVPPPEKDPVLSEESDTGNAAHHDDTGENQEENGTSLELRLATLVRARRTAPVCRAPANAAAARLDKLFACECHGGSGVPPLDDRTAKARPPREIAQWRTLMSARLDSVRAHAAALGRILMKARAATLAKIEADFGSPKYQVPSIKKSPVRETRAVGGEAPHLPLDTCHLELPATKSGAAADLLFDLDDFTADFTGFIEKQATAALKKAGSQAFAEFGRDDPFTMPPQAALDFIRARQNRLAGAPGEIWEQIKGTLEDGLNDGDTMQQLADRVRASFNSIDRERSMRIAMTEVAAAYGTARDEAMRECGVPFKRWLTSGNANVRLSHAAANGQTVRVRDPFIVDGEPLAFPGDPNGSPGNIINCHCVSIAVAEEN